VTAASRHCTVARGIYRLSQEREKYSLPALLKRDQGRSIRHVYGLGPWIGPDVEQGAVLGRLGPLEVRLARDEAEIEAAQAVRYRVFREEFGAHIGNPQDTEARDADRFDSACDHLLVIDNSLSGPPAARIVGTYRLLRQERAVEAGGFYSEQEFELRDLIAGHPDRRFLELGRSCVDPTYRSRRTIELLWQGIWAYINHYDIATMTGCASFPGVVPAAHAMALSYLAQNHRASGEWDVRAVPSRYRIMDLMPSEAVVEKAAVRAMPALIKGYLRLGARFADGCVVDHDFGTTDVLVVLPAEFVSMRHVQYFEAEARRFAG
jgi:putative hemolysin